MMDDDSKFLHTCDVCGKLFYVPDADSWVYKRQRKSHHGKTCRVLWFCSYHCKREEENRKK